MSDKQRGDYRLVACTINGVSVKQHVQSIEIVQDINENYFHGEISLADNTGDIEKLNLKGQDDILIKYFTQDDSLFTWKGKILFSTISIKNSNHIYTIKFIDPIYFKLEEHYSWSINDKVSNIVNKFYTEKLNGALPIEIDDTLWKFTYVFSNWTGNKIIDFLEKRAKSTKGGTLFKFYRSKDNYNFKSIEDILKTAPEHILSYSTNEVNRGDKSTKETQYRNLNIDIFGNASNYKLGQDGNLLYVVDVFNKELIVNETFSKGAPNIKILKHRHDNKLTGYISHFTEIIGQRVLKIGELNNNVISLDLPGSGIVDIGKVYKVKIPTSIKDDKTQKNSINLSGNFVCTKVTHKLGATCESKLVLQRIIGD